MYTFSIWDVILVTFPEQLLVLAITLAVAGYRDVLNFKKPGNLIRFLLTVLLMVLHCVICSFLINNSNAIKLLVNMLGYLIIIYALYRHSIVKCLGGLLVSTLIILAGEALSMIILAEFFQLSLNQTYNSLAYLVLITTPPRLLQLFFLFYVCYRKKISLHIKALPKSELVTLLLCNIVIFMNVYQLDYLINLESRSLKESAIMIFTAIITAIFSIYTLLRLMNMEKKLFINANVHNIDLQRIKQLIGEGRSEYAAELIDLTLKENKYED